MPKKHKQDKKSRRQNWQNCDLTSDSLIEKWNSLKSLFLYFSLFSLNSIQTRKLKPNQTLFNKAYSNLVLFLFFYKKLMYFDDFTNRNFSVLWLKSTQTMEMKQNQIFFHGTYSNLTSYIFLTIMSDNNFSL